MDEERFAALEARLTSLEEQFAALRKQIFAATGAPAPTPSVVVQRPATRITQTTAVAPPPPRTFNAEAFFGGRFLLFAGALAFLIGVGFFLKYAFDNGWIGPSGRVAIGLFSGIALVYVGDVLFRRDRRYYAQALSGLGAAILYLSLWAAGSYFHLLPLAVTFGAMVLVTAAVMAISLRRNAAVLAFAAIAGGMITPALNAGPSANVTALFAYLAILDTALLYLMARRWPYFEAFAFAGTQLWLFAEMPQNSAWSPEVRVTLIFATVFLLQFTAPAFLRVRRLASARPYEVVMAVLVAGAYYLALYAQLYDTHRMWLTACTVALAALYVCAAVALRERMRETAAAIALALVTIGVGITLTGATEAAAWSVESAALIFLGARMRSIVIRGIGYFAFLFAIGAMQQNMPGGALFRNPRFGALFITALAFGAAARALQRLPQRPYPEKYLAETAEAIAHIFALFAIGFELDAVFPNGLLPISLLMLVYAVCLVVAGFAFKRVFTRWEGLVLFGALILKVFFVDLSSVDTIVRIVSFLALGGVLLAVAFAYQRMQARGGEAG
jgi:uncharacterized membrane protein